MNDASLRLFYQPQRDEAALTTGRSNYRAERRMSVGKS